MLIVTLRGGPFDGLEVLTSEPHFSMGMLGPGGAIRHSYEVDIVAGVSGPVGSYIGAEKISTPKAGSVRSMS